MYTDCWISSRCNITQKNWNKCFTQDLEGNFRSETACPSHKHAWCMRDTGDGPSSCPRLSSGVVTDLRAHCADLALVFSRCSCECSAQGLGGALWSALLASARKWSSQTCSPHCTPRQRDERWPLELSLLGVTREFLSVPEQHRTSKTKKMVTEQATSTQNSQN